MEKFLGRYSDYLYALMRIFVGLAFSCNGARKLFGVFGGLDGAGAGGAVSCAILVRRGDRIFRRRPGRDWAVHRLRGLHRQRRDGRRLFSESFSQGFLADIEHRRARGLLLLHVPFYLQPRRRQVGPTIFLAHVERREPRPAPIDPFGPGLYP
jgi:hypothetical protein